MRKKIAITGGIGSGKSVVLHCLQEMGYPVFSCDEIYTEVCRSDDYLKALNKHFPDCIVSGILDRTKLSRKVFNDKKALDQLNAIAHPFIMKRLFQKMDKCKDSISFAEVPLLFECNYEDQFHETIYVKRNKDLRILSVMQRDGLSKADVLQRIQNQFDEETEEGIKKLKNPNVHILKNDGDLLTIKNWLKEFILSISK